MLGLRAHSHERELAAALAASLDAVQSGAASVEDCLLRYPALAAELEPLLRASACVQLLGRVAPTEQARLDARYAFMQAAARRARPAPVVPHPAVQKRAWLALAPAGVAALLFAIIAVPVLGSIDSGSVPGDWNYSFKRATERVRLALTTDPAERRLLRIEFASRRLREIERLSSHGQLDAHRPEVAALAHDYTLNLDQVTTSVQASGSLPASTKGEISNLTTQAQAVLPAIAQNAPASDPVKSAVQDAVDQTQKTDAVVKAVPTPPARSSAQANPTHTPIPVAAAVLAPANTPAPNTATPPPATPATSEPTAPPPPVTATVSAPTATQTPLATSASPAPRAATTVPVVVNTPVSPATAAPTALAVVPTPASAPSASAPLTTSVAPVGGAAGGVIDSTIGPEPRATVARGTAAAVDTAPARIATLAPATPLGRTPTSSAPTAVGTRAATVIPPVTGSATLSVGPNVWKYVGPAAPLDQITASITGQLVVVYYVNDQQTTSTWYPTSPGPAPVVPTGTVMTLSLRGPAVIAAPGVLVAAPR